jgi:glycosyltransferase involved in cell wall biosynthesis
MNVSVIISTHNPNIGRLHRTLEALAQQTLPSDEWEIILVDNASHPPLTIEVVDNGRRLVNMRIIRETRLGLTYGRLAGVEQSRGEIVVFVDDDNLLESDYLAWAREIFARHPAVGFGGGDSLAEWEVSPQPWMMEFCGNLAVRSLGHREAISSATPDSYPSCAPIGAGMVARRSALKDWIERCRMRDPLLDRRGTELTSAGDCDIVMCGLAAGWQIGYFPALRLTHLIAAERLTRDYLARLNHGIAKSWVQVLASHGRCPWKQAAEWTVPMRKWRAYFRYRAWAGPAEYVRWRGACGHFEGRALIKANGISSAA